MAMPETTLLFLAALAFACSLVPLLKTDRMTQAVLAFVASLVWGMVGLSANNVVIDDAAQVAEPIPPMIVLGFGFAALTGLLGIWRFLQAVRVETEEVDDPGDWFRP